MIIGIDGNEANVEKKVGVSVYTLNLLQRFREIATHNVSFIIYLKQRPLPHMPAETVHFTYRIVSGPFLWSRIFLPIQLFLHREIDVYFAPAHYMPPFCPVPAVVTIHDVSYFYYPQEFLKKDLYKLQKWTEESISKAKNIIAVSKTTKKDILTWYKVDDKKVHVIYNGFEKVESDEEDEQILNTYKLEKEAYILYVGTLQPRKNVKVLIQAFKKISQENEKIKLVLTGKKGWLYQSIYEEVQKQELSERVIFTDFIPDKDVITLYRHAHCFVLPSLYEGFGIPILEAMSYNCPVIASQSSSLPEIGGDACLYFNPQDPDDLADKIRSMLNNPSLRDSYIIKGKERTNAFSWQTCSQNTLDIIMQTYDNVENNT